MPKGENNNNDHQFNAKLVSTDCSYRIHWPKSDRVKRAVAVPIVMRKSSNATDRWFGSPTRRKCEQVQEFLPTNAWSFINILATYNFIRCVAIECRAHDIHVYGKNDYHNRIHLMNCCRSLIPLHRSFFCCCLLRSLATLQSTLQLPQTESSTAINYFYRFIISTSLSSFVLWRSFFLLTHFVLWRQFAQHGHFFSTCCKTAEFEMWQIGDICTGLVYQMYGDSCLTFASRRKRKSATEK